MGVSGLWETLNGTGKEITLKSLENKTLAVDVSIWLHQAVNGVYERRGTDINDVHLIVLFRRICTLLKNRIKPVFVFDGRKPDLKQRLVDRRRELATLPDCSSSSSQPSQVRTVHVSEPSRMVAEKAMNFSDFAPAASLSQIVPASQRSQQSRQVSPKKREKAAARKGSPKKSRLPEPGEIIIIESSDDDDDAPVILSVKCVSSQPGKSEVGRCIVVDTATIAISSSKSLEQPELVSGSFSSSQVFPVSQAVVSGSQDPILVNLSQASQSRNVRPNVPCEQFRVDCQHLMRLFGVPFVNSPGEAEAQCAFLEMRELTDGTITDDGDVLLFGGRKLYKQFFDSKRPVGFDLQDISQTHGLTRESLVSLALLTGSDYTEGIKQVGRVKALEIIAEFGNDGLQSLHDFKLWWSNAHDLEAGKKAPNNKRRKGLLRLVVPESFPDSNVISSYMDPVVDRTISQQNLVYTKPNFAHLRDFSRTRFNWEPKKIDEHLLPVIKRFSDTKIQARMHDYFPVQEKRRVEPKLSGRVAKAVGKIKSSQDLSQAQKI